MALPPGFMNTQPPSGVQRMMQTMPAMPQRGLTPQPVQQQPGQQVSPQQVQMEVRNILQTQPQVAQQIQQAVQQAVASGELTPQELDMAIRLARVAMADPSMYPQVRAFAIQQGIATEQELPQQPDMGMLAALLAVAESMQQQPQQAQAGQPPQAQGGYQVPEHVVRMKGQEFFDKLNQRYDPNAQRK